MKASERIRLEASLGNNVHQPWPMVALRKAADLLDECERMLVVGVEVTGDDFAEGIGRWRDEVKTTLAKLRGDAQ